MLKEQILEDYDKHREALKFRGQAVEKRLDELLRRNGIKVHSVSHRLKDPESLRYKVSRPDKTYHSLWDVTDVVAARVTTYFEDTIETVARLIEAEFDVDLAHSSDKLGFRDYGSFGYRSLHYVCRLNLPDEPISAEWPAEARFEIQIRTVLQHAWAEIEHDIGYKADDSVPESIRRRFSRIASLLEVADEEFVSIRKELERYAETVKEIARDVSRPVPLDRLSLPSFVLTPEVSEMDQKIAMILGKSLSEELFFPEYLLKMLKLSGLVDTAAVRAALELNRDRIIAMVPPYFEFAGATWKLNAAQLEKIYRGYSLFFLSHVVVLQSGMLELNKVEKVARFYRELDYPNDERAAHQVASGLIQMLKRGGVP